MTLRVAGPDDIPAVAALEAMLFGTDAWTAAQVREELMGERRHAWVAVDAAPFAGAAADAVVGYVVTLAVGAPVEVVDLLRIAVHPDHRRRGHARALLDTAVSAAAEAGARRMLLEVGAGNAGALVFYSACGFSAIDRRRRYYRDGSDAVVMERCLTG